MFTPENCYKAWMFSGGHEPRPFDKIAASSQKNWIEFAAYFNSLGVENVTALNVYNAFRMTSHRKKDRFERKALPEDISSPEWYQMLADKFNELGQEIAL